MGWSAGSASISDPGGGGHWAPVPLRSRLQIEVIFEGLEHNAFDAAIGAITITPERVARVDFSYPAHRSGVAVAVKKDGSAMVAIRRYGAIVADLSPLVAFTLALLVAIGVTMWFVERPKHTGAHEIRCRYAA